MIIQDVALHEALGKQAKTMANVPINTCWEIINGYERKLAEQK